MIGIALQFSLGLLCHTPFAIFFLILIRDALRYNIRQGLHIEV